MSIHIDFLMQALREHDVFVSLPEGSVLEPIIEKVTSLAMLHVISEERPGVDQDISLTSLRSNDRDALRLLKLLFPQASPQTLIQILDVIKGRIAEVRIEAKKERKHQIFSRLND